MPCFNGRGVAELTLAYAPADLHSRSIIHRDVKSPNLVRPWVGLHQGKSREQLGRAGMGRTCCDSSDPCTAHRIVEHPPALLLQLVDRHWVVKVSDFNLSKILEGAQGEGSSTGGGASNPIWLVRCCMPLLA